MKILKKIFVCMLYLFGILIVGILIFFILYSVFRNLLIPFFSF